MSESGALNADTTVLSSDRSSWESFPLSGPNTLTPRAFHTMTSIPNLNKLVAIGGQMAGFNSTSVCDSNNLDVLTLAGTTWSIGSQTATGTLPSCMWGHSATLVTSIATEIFVLGGCTSPGPTAGSCTSWNDNYYSLTIPSTGVWIWSTVTLNNFVITPRFLHNAVAYGNSVYVHGGVKLGGGFGQEVFQIVRDSSGWTCTLLSGQTSASGSGLWDFGAAAVISSGVFVMFAGQCGDCQGLSYPLLKYYDIVDKGWTVPTCVGQPPGTLVGMKAAVISFKPGTGVVHTCSFCFNLLDRADCVDCEQDETKILAWGGLDNSSSASTAGQDPSSSSLYMLTLKDGHNFRASKCNQVCVGVTVAVVVVGIGGLIGFWLWRRRTGKDRKDNRVMKMKRMAKLGTRDPPSGVSDADEHRLLDDHL
jgi:Galactose oxidase, central domain